ncbi:hypothetical protein H6F78_12395 [Coleofasciculus sp. FACHB-64]|uniref:hypothetical protein n=1 Tax=Cyanophyceae TaxID=3028117 RepID=UPI00168893E3|nr:MULTISPECIES: hypothetical protein [unclassified Coleofasciculus]MBD1837894.1 hypothetical protein [Coleofasciculus sp. FACHB-501]MBD2046384.1 hypothetical protein [Coleofasciculus sp. FACHB-64]
MQLLSICQKDDFRFHLFERSQFRITVSLLAIAVLLVTSSTLQSFSSEDVGIADDGKG